LLALHPEFNVQNKARETPPEIATRNPVTRNPVTRKPVTRNPVTRNPAANDAKRTSMPGFCKRLDAASEQHQPHHCFTTTKQEGYPPNINTRHQRCRGSVKTLQGLRETVTP